MSFLCLIFGYLCVPELKGRSLEEIEVMFEAKVPLRGFGNHVTDQDGIGAAVSRIERLDRDDPRTAKLHANAQIDEVDETERRGVKHNGA